MVVSPFINDGPVYLLLKEIEKNEHSFVPLTSVFGFFFKVISLGWKAYQAKKKFKNNPFLFTLTL